MTTNEKGCIKIVLDYKFRCLNKTRRITIYSNPKLLSFTINFRFKNDLKTCHTFLLTCETEIIRGYIPILMNFGFSSLPSVSNQLGLQNDITTNRNATEKNPRAQSPVFDLETISKVWFSTVFRR